MSYLLNNFVDESRHKLIHDQGSDLLTHKSSNKIVSRPKGTT